MIKYKGYHLLFETDGRFSRQGGKTMKSNFLINFFFFFLTVVSCALIGLVQAQSQQLNCFESGNTRVPCACFENGDELRDAVKSYLNDTRKCSDNNDCQNRNPALRKYGWPINTWCTYKVKDFDDLFKDQYTFNDNISAWNTSAALTMDSMFHNAFAFNQDLSFWDVSNVTSMTAVFFNASSFNGDVYRWNTRNVTNMIAMFFNATSFNQDLSEWNVKKVQSFQEMFSSATAFNGDVALWDISSATTVHGMFLNAFSFNIDLSLWDFSNVSFAGRMFQNATSFDQDISGWDTRNLVHIDYMFNGASSFNQKLNGAFWSVDKVTDYLEVFVGSGIDLDSSVCTWNQSWRNLYCPSSARGLSTWLSALASILLLANLMSSS